MWVTIVIRGLKWSACGIELASEKPLRRSATNRPIVGQMRLISAVGFFNLPNRDGRARHGGVRRGRVGLRPSGSALGRRCATQRRSIRRCCVMKETMPDRVRTLEQRHRSLSQQVDRLERRAYLTPFEQRQITDLKKLKLMAKDE